MISSRRRAMVGIAFCAALLRPNATASAHERSVSYSTIQVDGSRARVSLRMTPLDLSRIPPDRLPSDANLGAWLAERLTLSAGKEPCRVDGAVQRLPDTEGRAIFEWTLTCEKAGPLSLRSALLREIAPSHLHFARLVRPGRATIESLLSADAPVWEEAGAQSGIEPSAPHADGGTHGGFVRLGVEHILSGWDHLAFVLALLLGATSLGDVARMVTGFSIGHSLTLAMATLGWLEVDATAVEALIGASIALVALENLWGAADRPAWIPILTSLGLVAMALAARFGHGTVPSGAFIGLAIFSAASFRALGSGLAPAAMRWAVAATFGLIHGFGFAAVLAEADLSTSHLARALLGFNIGVELGQLGVVTLVWPLLRIARRQGGREDRFEDFVSTVLLALGVGWLLGRTYAALR